MFAEINKVYECKYGEKYLFTYKYSIFTLDVKGLKNRIEKDLKAKGFTHITSFNYSVEKRLTVLCVYEPTGKAISILISAVILVISACLLAFGIGFMFDKAEKWVVTTKGVGLGIILILVLIGLALVFTKVKR